MIHETLDIHPASIGIATPPAVDTIGVLHVINGEHYAGAERVQDLLAAGLPECGFHVGFACLKPGRFEEARQYRAAPLVTLPMAHRLDLRAVWRLVAIIRRGGYRLVHAHTPRTAMVGRMAAWAAGVPMVYHVHSPAPHDSTRRWRNRVNALVEWGSLRGRSRLIAVSRSLCQHLVGQGYDPARIAVVHNGVPCLAPVPDRVPPRGVWTLGTVAWVRPRKGIEVLLDALALLRRQGLPVRLRVVGPLETPAYEAKLQAQVGRLGLGDSIDWTGFTTDVPAALRQMDLFILPSLFGEGLPMVVLEAMACGVPVVATRVEGVPEAIRDGREGVLAEPNDAAGLARAILRVVSGELDWAQLRARAIRRQVRSFSARSMAAGVARVYRQVLTIVEPDGGPGSCGLAGDDA
jgi:glycosyltransferase involved in cell wall biosynthesis